MSLIWKYSTTSLVAGSPKIKDRDNLLKTNLNSKKELCSNTAHNFDTNIFKVGNCQRDYLKGTPFGNLQKCIVFYIALHYQKVYLINTITALALSARMLDKDQILLIFDQNRLNLL